MSIKPSCVHSATGLCVRRQAVMGGATEPRRRFCLDEVGSLRYSVLSTGHFLSFEVSSAA